MTKFVISGARAGQTVNLGGYQFVEGVYTHESQDTDVSGISTFLERCYNAFPEGSSALDYANEVYAAEQGGTPVPVAPLTGEQSTSILEAINALNHEDDAHWTAQGLPSTEAVTDFAGTRVTRAQIDAAAPNYNRASAKAGV